MNIIRKYRPIIVLAVLLMECTFTKAQIQFPGKPMDDFSQLKAADVIYALPPAEPLEIEAAKQINQTSDKKVVQFALERPLDINPADHGKWMDMDQVRVWRMHVVSPGAKSIGLIFNEFALNEGVKVLIYDPDQHYIKGAYTSGNNKSSRILAVGHIPGDELIVEMQVPKKQDDFGVLRIESLSHAFIDIMHTNPGDDCPSGQFGCSQECEVDINCGEGSDWQLTKKSVVRIYTSRKYCTGVLLNNTSYDGTPYILTSEHCVNKEYYADRSVFDFNYESPGCFGGNGSLNRSLTGSDSIAIGDSIDFSLLRLEDTPPESYDVYYAGWELFDEQPSYTACLHHPNGDVKKISFDFQAPSQPADLTEIPNSDLRDYYYFSYWWIREWNIGSTEGGSSGSPLFNAGKRVIGILSGGKAECGASIGFDSVTNRNIFSKVPNKNDYFTKLNVAWNYNGSEGPSLKPWLDPANSGVSFIDGMYPNYTNVQSFESISRFSVFPNPVSSEMYVSANAGIRGMVTIKLYDISGTLQFSREAYGQGIHRFETKSLSSGIYLLIIEGEGEVEYHKIAVTR